DRVDTMADGLAAKTPGRIALSIASACVDQMITVEETEMLRAIRLYFEWEHLLAEPAGAAALAALLYHYAPEASERVVVLLSGASIAGGVMLRALKSGCPGEGLVPAVRPIRVLRTGKTAGIWPSRFVSSVHGAGLAAKLFLNADPTIRGDRVGVPHH